MNRRTSWILALSLGCSALMLAPGQAVASRGPVIERFTDSGSFVDTSLCGFPVHVAWREKGRVYEWFDSDGNLDYLVVHHVFSEIDRANGKVATGIDREKLTNTQQGYYLFNGSWIFFLPDGSHIQTAGRSQVTYDGAVLSDRGPHPIDEGRLAELFCPPMS